VQLFKLVLCTRAKFLDDLKDAPESTSDDQRAGFFDGTSQDDIDDEAGDNDGGIEDVELGVEESAQDLLDRWSHGRERNVVKTYRNPNA